MCSTYHHLVTVYVEVVLLNNFAVDFALCISTQLLCNKRLRLLRATIASILGAVVAFCYAFSPNILQIVIKIILAPVMSLIAVKIDGKSAKCKLSNYLKSTIAFCLLTYFTGGIVYGLSFALHIDISSYIVLALVASSVAVCVIAVYMLARRKSKGEKTIKQVEIVVAGKKHVYNGLCDSGNLLVDSFSSLPVVILSKVASDAFEDVKREGIICVQTVVGNEDMPLVKPDAIFVDSVEKKALCAISQNEFDEYDIILQNSLF